MRVSKERRKGIGFHSWAIHTAQIFCFQFLLSKEMNSWIELCGRIHPCFQLLSYSIGKLLGNLFHQRATEYRHNDWYFTIIILWEKDCEWILHFTFLLLSSHRTHFFRRDMTVYFCLVNNNKLWSICNIHWNFLMRCLVSYVEEQKY